MVELSIVSWNVNSVRIRMELLKELAAKHQPDVICLQEVKAKEADFPFNDIKMLGYEHIALYGMAGYNGVAILSKFPLENIEQKDWVSKHDARHIKAVVKGIEINDIYIPAGGDIPDPIENLSFAHKLCFMDDMAEYYEQSKTSLSDRKIMFCGDFNVAPSENDVWNHKQMLGIVSHTPIEVQRLTRLFNSLNFIDAVRQIYPEPEKNFSWWSYRNPNWQTNNKGRRLDHIWVTPNMQNMIKDVKILREFRSAERPSDHVPVLIKLDLPE